MSSHCDFGGTAVDDNDVDAGGYGERTHSCSGHVVDGHAAVLATYHDLAATTLGNGRDGGVIGHDAACRREVGGAVDSEAVGGYADSKLCSVGLKLGIESARRPYTTGVGTGQYRACLLYTWPSPKN